MTHDEWIKFVESLILKYKEGIITSQEVFDTILSSSGDVVN